MACHSLFFTFLALILVHSATGFTGSEYYLDAEYSGHNFFDGWDFFTGDDPTHGFVTYLGRASAQFSNLVHSAEGQPVYIGSDYDTVIPLSGAPGRPSVRISTKKAWTHGLFVGDFKHAPGGVCGSWPAFWTLGPNWPFHGEVDIMEGVNLNTYNGMVLHTSSNCTISQDGNLMTGQVHTKDCASYPDNNIGCGIGDDRPLAFGSGFNAIGGGVYVMQWTSEYIKIWLFPRGQIPEDLSGGHPNPSTWGTPQAHMQGSCVLDDHFQSHKIVLNNAFCGDYAGNPGVWNSDWNSCAKSTGLSTCEAYVASNPAAFKNSFWEINHVRVYQLKDPNATVRPSLPYIASLEPPQPSLVLSPPSPPSPTGSLCSAYNFTVIKSGTSNYEIECGVDLAGPNIGPPQPDWNVSSFEDCVAGCNYWNAEITPNLCGGVSFDIVTRSCSWKSSVRSTLVNSQRNGARLIYYAYPLITDEPLRQTAFEDPVYVPTSVTPQTYRPFGASTSTSSSLVSETLATSFTTSVGLESTSSSSQTSPPPSSSSSSHDSASTTSKSTTPTISPVSASESSSVGGTASPSHFSNHVWPSSISNPSSLWTVNSGSRTSNPVSSASATTSTLSTPSFGLTPNPHLPGPFLIDYFRYAGCLGLRPGRPYANSFVASETSELQSVSRCVRTCLAKGMRYAAVHDTTCFCSSFHSSTIDMDIDYVNYPDWFCNYPCRGNPAEKCGGIATSPTAKEKRQLPANHNYEQIVLLTVYNSTFTGNETDEDNTPGTTSPSSSVSVSIPTSTTGLSTPDPAHVSSRTPAPSGPSWAPSTTTSAAAVQPVIISTAYTTICPPHPQLCPTPSLTCLTTTITVLHCGCSAEPQPTVPMTTTSTMIACASGCGGRHGHDNRPEGDGQGAGSPITLTVPWTSEIAMLESSVRAWMSPQIPMTSDAAAAATWPIESPPATEYGSRNTPHPPPLAIMTITLVPVPVHSSVHSTNGNSTGTIGQNGTTDHHHDNSHITSVSSSPPPPLNLRPSGPPLQNFFMSGASRSISTGWWGSRMKHPRCGFAAHPVLVVAAIVVGCLLVPIFVP